MAEQIPYGVATSLVDRLASAAFLEFGRICGVKDELERLKNTVESIKAVLLDAEEKQEQSHAVQNWIRRLKDVLHPADDLLDEFVIEDMRHKVDASHKNKVKEVFHSLSPNRIAFRHKMACEIEKTRKNFNDVVEEMSKLNLIPNGVVVKQYDSVRRETGSFVLESEIIGREDSKKEIIGLLRQPHISQNVSSVAIVGIGGLGKTALAQLVYNDGEVQKNFEKRMWVCVSENFDVKTIAKKILESLMNSKIDDGLSLDNLQNQLRENLTGKRYLLVLDDIWNESHEKWTQLRTYLMCGAQDSKVLVTTRSKIVAQTMGVSVPYVLNGLTPEESWSLLKNIAFGDDTSGVSRTLESVGKKIAEKCKGVPLAIRTLGGRLQNTGGESEWIDVLEGDFWKLCEDKESIMPVLKLSYQNLSLQLRQCFAYCSLYPKDWEIRKDELIQLWMAQGYLECSAEKRLMEDVGNQFVKIFLMKSFFQDAEMDEHGDIARFKMHDLMHDLATIVAGNDCCYLDSEAKRPVGRPRHVWLELEAVGLLDSLDASRLRTLILRSNIHKLEGEELSVISKFKCLRVLMLSDSSLSKLSGSIGKLKHLRYLDLELCVASGSLSKSISNLVCLQTLGLDVLGRVELSTKVFSKLINLRHLYIDNCGEMKKSAGCGKLSVRRHEGMIFSRWLSSLTNIVEISLSFSASLQYLPPLEHLPFLKSLVLTSLVELEYIYYEEGSPVPFFPSLENLGFCWCDKLRGWWRVGDDINDTNCSHHLSLPPFPRLSLLMIEGCPMLTRMPTFPNLDKGLDLTDCSVEPLEATLNIAASDCSIEFPPLSMLKCLNISGPQLDVKKFPNDWLQNLTSLKNLSFGWLSSQTFQEIGIWFNDNLNCFPSLQKITFGNCDDIEALPDWMCNLLSLQQIKVLECGKLISLPGGMRRLTNLETLEIIECPLLVEECRTETSATWPKIAHIANIILK